MRLATSVRPSRSRPVEVDHIAGSRISIGSERLDYRRLEPRGRMTLTSLSDDCSEYFLQRNLREGTSKIEIQL